MFSFVSASQVVRHRVFLYLVLHVVVHFDPTPVGSRLSTNILSKATAGTQNFGFGFRSLAFKTAPLRAGGGPPGPPARIKEDGKEIEAYISILHQQ